MPHVLPVLLMSGRFRGSRFSQLIYAGLALFFCASLNATTEGKKQSEEGKPAAGSNSSASCLECHSDQALTMRKQKREVSLFVDQARLAKSAHGALDCADCHEGFDSEAMPHKKPMTPVNCASCHEDMAKKHAFHANLSSSATEALKDVACTVCHGGHEVAKMRSAEFPFAAKRQADGCGQCHEMERKQFFDSAHGKALANGSTDAPVCLSCHQKPITSKDGQTGASVELKLAQADLCQSCHVKKASVAGQALRGTQFVLSFDQSVHGVALHQGKAAAANCDACAGSTTKVCGPAAMVRLVPFTQGPPSIW